jgi:hypothetical protein
MEPRSEHDDGGVYAVVVIYRRAWGDAAAMPLLRDWRDADVSDMHTPALRQLLVWDNSPEPVGPPPDDRERFEYMSDRDNGGTRAAYTEACRRAAALGVPWVLLLDQDTLPPEGFAAAVGRAIADPSNASAAALVPRVQHDGRLVSPAVILPSGRVVPRHLGAAGGGGADVPTAIASGTVNEHGLVKLTAAGVVAANDGVPCGFAQSTETDGVEVGVQGLGGADRTVRGIASAAIAATAIVIADGEKVKTLPTAGGT